MTPDAGTAVQQVLEETAAAITSEVPSVRWQTERPVSSIYDLVVVFAFTPNDDPSRELVVVTVEAQSGPQPWWTTDVADGNGRLLVEDVRFDGETAMRFRSNPSELVAMLREYLAHARDSMIAAVSAR